MIKAGTTFLIPDPGPVLDPHLWVIISDPEQDPDHVLLVNFTSWRKGVDESCVVEPGDHPFFEHKSVVNYHDAVEREKQELQAALDVTRLEMREPLSPQLLERIRAGAAVSEHLEYRHRDLLDRQDLLPDNDQL